MAMPEEKKKQLRILDYRRASLETNYVKHLKESNTKFKIMISCVLEAFLYHRLST